MSIAWELGVIVSCMSGNVCLCLIGIHAEYLDVLGVPQGVVCP